MKIKEKMEGDIAILQISGKLMGGPETQELHEHIKGLIADNINKVIIDLSKVKWMNSSGLGVLMASYTTIKNKGGDLKLANVTDKVNSLLMITQLITIFKTYDTVDRAIVSFRKSTGK
ncbi:MAG: STAS domain-containing protein [Candidatus Helarchaeota archaeon]|nr:STAS domain-containing protein [Candidatus Helarchaeota archaeon]